MSVEAFLDAYFSQQGFEIESTTPVQERRYGLGDRIFTKDGKQWFVEYKSGIQTFYTGNIFLETVSVDTAGKPGWLLTCTADFIIYATILNKKLLVFRPDNLRAMIDQLKQKFPEVKTSNSQNTGYDTHGLIIPLEYAETNLAEKVIEL